MHYPLIEGSAENIVVVNLNNFSLKSNSRLTTISRRYTGTAWRLARHSKCSTNSKIRKTPRKRRFSLVIYISIVFILRHDLKSL